MSDVSNQWRGMRARSMGQTFEAIIDAGCAWYRERGLAYIEKTPEPMRPLRAPNSKGQFLACYTKAAQPDYKGTILGGRSIVIEAKHTDSGRIDQSRTSSEQMEALATHYGLGGLAFVLVSFGLTEYFMVPWLTWRDMKELFGRKYLTPNDIRDYEVYAPLSTLLMLEKVVGRKVTE